MTAACVSAVAGKRFRLDGIFATGGIFIFSSYSNNKTPLTFRIVDSPMGVGKSQCLMNHIRFSASCHPPGVMNNRYIIFVPTLRERDKRFRKKLGVKTPEDRPYSQSIRDMILDGDKYCVLNHISMEYYHVDGDRFVKNPDGRYIETYPEGIENLVILDDPRFNVDFSLSKNWYERAKAENDPALEFDNDNYALSELVQFVWRSHVRVKDAHQPVYVWVPDGRMRKLLQEFQKRAMEGRKNNI